MSEERKIIGKCYFCQEHPLPKSKEGSSKPTGTGLPRCVYETSETIPSMEPMPLSETPIPLPMKEEKKYKCSIGYHDCTAVKIFSLLNSEKELTSGLAKSLGKLENEHMVVGGPKSS